MDRTPLWFRAADAVRVGWRHHGPMFPLVALHRLGLYRARKWFGPKSFQLAGVPHAYFLHPFILNTERVVEVALARDFLRERTGDILEVGNVLHNFIPFAHDVVDKYERAPGVINQDIIDFAPGKQYRVIVTLSTLEHVGWDEQPREPEKIKRAIEGLKALLKPGGELLATMPLGYNHYLDELVREGNSGFPQVLYLKRVSANNTWREVSLPEVARAEYGRPFACANALMVAYYRGAG